MAANIKTVGVVGTGVIGASWVGLFLAKGLQVIVASPGADAESKLSAHLDKIWPLLERRGLAPGASLKNYQFVGSSLADHYESLDFVQENAPERADLKAEIIASIDQGTRPNVVIASSSSGLPSSTFINLCKKNPGRVLIGHPFNPPHVVPLVEIVPHPGTAEEYITTARDFYQSLGKSPIVVRQETPGFVANRIQAAVNHEAFSLVQRGIVTAKELDLCMTSSLGPSWTFTGPFAKDALGGGPGGFQHLMRHIGPGMQGWLQDMAAHAYQYNEENLLKIDASVKDLLKGVDLARLESVRNELLVDLFREKAGNRDLIN